METLEKSRMCRLCGKESGIAVDIFDKNENHVRKINAILPVLVHEMDLLPKQMCHRCSYKLEEFYDFYVNCAKTDTELKSQLSWMSKENLTEKIVTPMVKMNPFKIKMEPPDEKSVDPKMFGQFSENSLFFPASFLQHSFEAPSPMITCSRCRCLCNNSIKEDEKSSNTVENSSKANSENKVPSLNLEPQSSSQMNKLKEITSSSAVLKNINEEILVAKTDNAEYSKSNKINRALRPRKNSVDYMGQKKKGSISSIKTKLKSGVGIFDPTLVTAVNIKLSPKDLSKPSPIVKLEKVDDQMSTLRKRKNLEEFNKRVKEFQLKKKKEESRSKKVLQNRKDFQKEVNLRRKSLQYEENLGNYNKRSVPKDILKRRSVYVEESSTNGKSSLLAASEKTEQSLNFDPQDNFNEKVLRITQCKIKQEVITKVLESDRPSNEKLDEDKTSKKVLQGSSKAAEKLPLQAVVKLEKDYTCNIDYPRIKIKKHHAVSDLPKPQDGAIGNLIKINTCEEVVNKKQPIKDIVQKNLRSTEQRLKAKSSSPEKPQKSKKKKKKIEVDASEQVEINSSSLNHDLKRRCEKCNDCFGNSELYKLHPCYQS